MQTQQQPQEIILKPDQEQLLNNLLQTVPKPRQLSWLQLSGLKLTTEKQLEAKILEIQQILNGWDTMELIPLQAVLEKAKKLVNEVAPLRKSFTKYLDTIFDQMMSIEKRALSLEVVAKATARELELREAKETTDASATNKATEAANFKAHVQNEYVRISTGYKIALNNYIKQSYLTALDQEFTDDGLIEFINKIAADLQKIEKPAAVKFAYTLHQADELNALHKTIPAPNYNDILTNAIGSIADTFKMYHQDKQNKEVAKAQITQEFNEVNSQIENQATKIQSVNNLVAKGASSTIVDTLPGAKKVKRKQVIQLQDTREEAIKIVSEFLARWTEVETKLKIKSWANLDVKKMAAALQELTDDQGNTLIIEGLVYVEVKK